MEETTMLFFYGSVKRHDFEMWPVCRWTCAHGQISIHLNIGYRKIYLITILWSHSNTWIQRILRLCSFVQPPKKLPWTRMMHSQQGYITSLALMMFYLLTRNLCQDTSRLTEVHFILKDGWHMLLGANPVRNENLWIPFWVLRSPHVSKSRVMFAEISGCPWFVSS